MKIKTRIKLARKLVADIFEDIMNDIPTIPEDETLDEQAERELEMEAELGTTQEEDMSDVIRALKKKFNIESDNLSDILDQVEKKKKEKDYEEPKTLLSQLNTNMIPTQRYQVTVQYPEFDESGSPFFAKGDDVLEETLSVSDIELSGLKEQESRGFLKILAVDERIPRPR